MALHVQSVGETLRLFGTLDEAREVRMAGAENACVPVAVLRILATDKARGVRKAIAELRQPPVDILHLLAQDRTEDVRRK